MKKLIEIAAGDGAKKVLLFVHEGIGIRPELLAFANSFVRPDRAVYLIDLYEGKDFLSDGDMAAITEFHKSMSTDVILQEFQDALSHLSKHYELIIIIGVSFGGYWAVRAATLSPPPARVIAVCPTPGTFVPPVIPITTVMPEANCPVQLHWGDQEPICQSPLLEQIQTQAGTQGHEVYVYEGEGHVFIHPDETKNEDSLRLFRERVDVFMD